MTATRESGPDGTPEDPDLGAEDRKLVVLARAARARTDAAEGAAVRDLDGRTYAASTVVLDVLQLSALELAVAIAVSSGGAGLEAAAVVSGGPEHDDMDLRLDVDPEIPPGRGAGVEAARALGGAGVPVVVAGLDGEVRATWLT